VIYALGQVNFLFDRTQQPHTTPDELSAAFGLPVVEARVPAWAAGPSAHAW
jgi:hypothetical protein